MVAGGVRRRQYILVRVPPQQGLQFPEAFSFLLVALPPHSSLEITMSHSALGSNGTLGPASAFHDRGWYNRDYRLAIDHAFSLKQCAEGFPRTVMST